MVLVIINAIGAIFSLICVISTIIKDDFKWAIIFTLCLVLNMISLVVNLNESYSQNDNVEISTPTAKDVYDGKTTLRIVYEDSIPVDTIVVFKKEFR